MPKVNDKVLVKTQPMSDAIKGTTSKFMLLGRGSWQLAVGSWHWSSEDSDLRDNWLFD